MKSTGPNRWGPSLSVRVAAQRPNEARVTTRRSRFDFTAFTLYATSRKGSLCSLTEGSNEENGENTGIDAQTRTTAGICLFSPC